MFQAARENLQITGLGTKFVFKKINIKSSLVTRLFVQKPCAFYNLIVANLF